MWGFTISIKLYNMKYKLEKSRFLNWMFNDSDDQKYWGTYFLNELKQNGKIEYSVEQMLNERDELPMYIMQGCDEMIDEMVYDMNEIELINTIELFNMKNNKLIAEFMDLETETFHSGILNYYHQDIAEGSFFEEHELSYNVSWDWLMPVVEKIEGLRDKNGNAYRFTIDMCNAQIEETNIEILGGAFKIDTTYDAVVQFINQYNKTI
jgi:hypothetical protein